MNFWSSNLHTISINLLSIRMYIRIVIISIGKQRKHRYQQGKEKREIELNCIKKVNLLAGAPKTINTISTVLQFSLR